MYEDGFTLSKALDNISIIVLSVFLCQLTVIFARQLKLRYFKWARDIITAAVKAMLVIMMKYACVMVVADPLQHNDKKQQIWNRINYMVILQKS